MVARKRKHTNIYKYGEKATKKQQKKASKCRLHATIYSQTFIVNGNSYMLQRRSISISHAHYCDSFQTAAELQTWMRNHVPVCSVVTCVLANSAFHPTGVGKWVPTSAGKAKAGMVHSVSGWTRGVQVKLWDPLRTRAMPERLRGVFTTTRYTNPCLRLPLFSGALYS